MSSADWDDIGGELSLSTGQEVLDASQGGAITRKSGNEYSTAIAVSKPRDLTVVAKRLEQEATLSGELFFYSWGSGKNRVVGPSFHLALAAARCYGNCVIKAEDVQDAGDAWIMPSTFVDLETGFTVTRSFRQAKKWTVHGKFDEERKDDMRFQIGQSKAARNVALNCIPKILIDRAMKAAQSGAREKLERYIKQNGLPKAVDYAISRLNLLGVPEDAILSKFGLASRNALTIDEVLVMKADIVALENGSDRPELLYESMGRKSGKPAARESSVEEKLAKHAKAKQEPEQSAPEQPEQPEAAQDATEASDTLSGLYAALDLAATVKAANAVMEAARGELSGDDLEAFEAEWSQKCSAIRSESKK